MHLAVEPRWLQPCVPFELDLYEGKAYVSLVAFTLRHLRPAWLDSPAGELPMRLLAPCRFLNVRTYVRAGRQDGIFFLGEWLSQWVNIPFGPLLYGLPYRPGRLRFARNETTRSMNVDVRGLGGGRLAYRAQADAATVLGTATRGSLDAFLLERYLAFTMRRGRPLVFRVEHAPWQMTVAEVAMEEAGLLKSTGEWSAHARVAGGHFTPGAFGVGMGVPQPVRPASSRSAFVS